VSIAWAATLLVLAALVVSAAASFFHSLQTGLLLLVGLPVVVLLHALLGTINTGFVVASLGILVALVRTIGETIEQLRLATRPSRSRPRAERQRDTGRSRIAA
jgi:Na+-transporting methylmalonyl-CoA/oxaloacetate decarboxylase gamma subunit